MPIGGALRNVHHIGLEVSRGALAEERQRLSALGLAVRTGEHPFLPVEAIYIDDPDGKEIELVARNRDSWRLLLGPETSSRMSD